ncbi:MAG TPA: hypothetical protein DCE44_09945, partial [Verrucomicrobiales bacterium]|nr:hypothetical protein [Verrucomicrobiales bacterium]
TDIAAMPSKQRKAWLGLLENAPKGTTSKPTAKWRKQADPLLAALGPETFATQIEHWFSLIGSNATARMQERNASLLRALVWYASLLDRESVCRALANAVEGGLRKLPAGGLYASSIAKACIAALEAMPGSAPVAQLSRLKHRVKSPWGQQEIQKALATVTRRSGMTEDELEEMTAPTFELDRDGKLCRQLSTLRVELTILGTREVELTCYNENGQQLSKETKIPKSDAAEVKALKNLAGDIGKMLAAQRERVERLFRTNRTWKLATWRERYLNHPLVGVIARRLIWEFTTDEKTTTGMSRPHSGRGEEALANAQFVDLDFQPIVVNDTTVVHLWHPVGKNVDEVIAWRDWLESRQIQQPFKQAHREVYLLTDAERNTRVYSNRFAAHILRQHQLKALCDARGWKYEFRGTWDPGDHAGATVDILQSGLRAQWWIGDGGDDYSPAGVALHVSTDQVRFYRTAEEIREDVSEPLPLDQIPPLVFSEIMRDVDLFVGVASVGNDSMWNDGGPDGRFRDYWQGYAFGDLSATAQTRKAILERLVPRLKIADQCSFADKFLIIRGQLRSYKIHLGSGNILMTPNDQYLCIVPKQSVPAGDGNVFLPFEGDHMLSVILSKAFLLAEDDRIKDATIASQLKR